MHIPKISRSPSQKAVSLLFVFAFTVAGSAIAQSSASVPFTDVSDCGAFLDPITEAYLTGLTSGTSDSTFDPKQTVDREQMAAFVTRTLDGSISRSIRRAALNLWAVPKGIDQMATSALGGALMNVISDGHDAWVADSANGRVLKVESNTGRVLETWTGATGAFSLVAAMGKIYAVSNAGALYEINPQDQPGDVNVVALAAPLLPGPTAIVFDGAQLCVIGYRGLSYVHPHGKGAWSVITDTAGFESSALTGGIFDGEHLWVTDFEGGALLEIDAYGELMRRIPVGANPMYPAYNGVNIFVPCFGDDAVAVVHAGNGAVVARITGNGLSGPESIAFDGQRILVTNFLGNSISVWKSTSLAALGTIDTGADSFPTFACSDGVNFFITLENGVLARF